MTDRLRLDSLGISGLRSIGWHPEEAGDDEKFQVKLENIPDVAIVAGPNGLGKSTIVAGLRLALTGRLPGRLGLSLPFNALRCQTVKGDGRASRVRASFRAGADAVELDWKARNQSEAEAQVERILARVKSLSDDTGLDGKDVVARLQITHLLGQGFGARFTDNQNGGTAAASLMNDALGDALLVERLDLLKGKGGPVIKELRQRQSTAENAKSEAKSKRREWSAALATWQSVAAAQRRVGPEQVDAERLRVLEALSRLGVSQSEHARLEDAITALRAEIARQRSALTQRTGSVAQLRRGTATLPPLRTAYQAAEAERKELFDAVKLAETALREAEAHYAHLQSARLSFDLEKVEQELEQQRATLNVVQQDQLWHRMNQLQERATKLRDQLFAVDSEITELDAGATESSLTKTHQAENSAKDALDAVEERRVAERQRLQGLGVALNEVRRAVELIPHVDDDAGVPCPACATPYPKVDLLERIQREITALGGDVLSSLDREWADASEQYQALKARVLELQALLNDAKTAVERAKSRQKSLKDEVDSLVNSPALTPVVGPEAVVPDVASLVVVVSRWLSGQKAPDRGVDDLIEEGGATELRIHELTARRQQWRTALNEMKLSTASPPMPAPDPPDEATLAAAEGEVQRLAAGRARAQEIMEAAVQSTDAARTALDSDEQRMRTAWSLLHSEANSLDLGDISGHLEVLDAAIHDDNRRLDAADEVVAGAQTVAAALHEDAEVRAAADGLKHEAKRLLGAETPDVEEASADLDGWTAKVSAILEEHFDDADIAASKAKEAVGELSKAVKVISERQRIRAKALVTAVQQPLETYAGLLMPQAPFDRVDAKIASKKYELLLSYSDNGTLLAAAEALSEGELTGLALSYLFAFNAVFGDWCRWPGLVLDDPFQAVDVVRINTLFDILGGMVRDRGRQLILTTHDLDRADWARRRLENQGAEVRVYELHQSATGVAVRTTGDHIANGPAENVPPRR